MMTSLVLLALAMGAVISIYLPMISQTARLLGSAPMANVPFFALAFASSVVIAVATGSRGGDFAKVGALPPMLLTAGIMSAGMIIGSSYLIPSGSAETKESGEPPGWRAPAWSTSQTFIVCHSLQVATHGSGAWATQPWLRDSGFDPGSETNDLSDPS